MMDLDEYQREAHKTANYNEKKTFPVLWPESVINNLSTNAIEIRDELMEVPLYPFLKVITESAESGEDIIKIAFREDKQYIEGDKLIKEIGDILWYVSEMSYQIGIPLSEIAKQNLIKLQDRQERNVIKGSGDTR